MMHPNLFDPFPDRASSAWLRDLPSDDRKAFGKIGYLGLMYSYGFEIGFEVFHKAGGNKRAKQAKRDKRGRFIKDNKNGKANTPNRNRQDQHAKQDPQEQDPGREIPY